MPPRPNGYSDFFGDVTDNNSGPGVVLIECPVGSIFCLDKIIIIEIIYWRDHDGHFLNHTAIDFTTTWGGHHLYARFQHHISSIATEQRNP